MLETLEEDYASSLPDIRGITRLMRLSPDSYLVCHGGCESIPLLAERASIAYHEIGRSKNMNNGSNKDGHGYAP